MNVLILKKSFQILLLIMILKTNFKYSSPSQAALDLKARGYIPPEKWDNGITAGILKLHL